MATEFNLPELGENIDSGDIVSILVKEGDALDVGQAILELETDKATVEVPSEQSGRILNIHVSEGDNVTVGQLILTLEPAEGANDKGEGSEASGEKASEKAAESVEKPSAAEPQKREQEPIRPPDRVATAQAEVVEFRERPRETRASGTTVPASPAVRRFAREIGMDLSQVSGSGPKGRISVEDVKAAARQLRQSPSPVPVVTAAELPDFSRFGEIKREPFNNVRRVTATHLSQAWANVVHVTNHDRADVTGFEELRRSHAPKVEAAGGKLTVTSILLKLCAAALRMFPKFNASIDVVQGEIIYKNYCNIGIAVDTDRGLLVPVIRDVDKKNVTELSIEVKKIAERARQGRVAPDELFGGCFTITNLGGIGGTYFTPVVNYPEAAILGVSRTAVEPVFRNGEFQPRKMLPLSLSYDHRLIDGADAARFLKWLVQAIEDPFIVLLDG